jgi:IstB-like ATP binding protein
LRLPVAADQFDAALQHAQDAGLSHLDFLHRLLADQAGLRRQRSIERRIKDAKFRDLLKPLGEFDWNFNPAISRVQIESLAQGDFIRRRQNVIFVGQSGLGKSRLMQNIGQAATASALAVLRAVAYYSCKLLIHVTPFLSWKIKLAQLFFVKPFRYADKKDERDDLQETEWRVRARYGDELQRFWYGHLIEKFDKQRKEEKNRRDTP